MPLTIWLLLLILSQPASVEQAGFPSPAAGEIRVDRGLQVVVFPDRVRLEYDLGLSPLAATAILKQNSRDLPESEDRQELMKAFRDMVLPDIQRRCRITAGGIPLEIRAIESRLFPKHYVQLTCIFEAPLPPAGETIRLQLVDGSFRGYDGNHLIALKAEDGVQLQASTVPLILARVPRQSLSSDSAAQREGARRAEAVVLRRHEAADSSRRTPEDAPTQAAGAAEPAGVPSSQPGNHWTRFAWVAGCSAGILAVIFLWWRRRGGRPARVRPRH